MFAKSKFDEAKYLTLGVGAVNVAFTIVAVSVGRPSSTPVLCAKQCVAQDKSYCTMWTHWNTSLLYSKFFLVERAGRRRLLLTGFLSLALCNMMMTITDSILVGEILIFGTRLYCITDFCNKCDIIFHIFFGRPLTYSNILLSMFPHQHIVPDVRSLHVFVVFFLISAYEVGPGPISWFIAAELFDQSARPMAMAFTSMLNWGGKFLLALLFPPLFVSKKKNNNKKVKNVIYRLNLKN